MTSVEIGTKKYAWSRRLYRVRRSPHPNEPVPRRSVERQASSLPQPLSTALSTHQGDSTPRFHVGLGRLYDSLIIASALEAGYDTLLTEDLRTGWRIDGPFIVNPLA